MRPPRAEDILPYTAFLARPEVSVWLDDSAQYPISAAQVETILLRDAWCLWSIDCGGKFVGVTSFYEPDLALGTARLSIVIGDRSYWKKGLGAAVFARVIEHGFLRLGLRKINSDYLHPNEAARIIHERAGFTREGVLREDAWRNGRWVDRVLVSYLQHDYLEQSKQGEAPR